jgi:hypothetical protein
LYFIVSQKPANYSLNRNLLKLVKDALENQQVDDEKGTQDYRNETDEEKRKRLAKEEANYSFYRKSKASMDISPKDQTKKSSSEDSQVSYHHEKIGEICSNINTLLVN